MSNVIPDPSVETPLEPAVNRAWSDRLAFDIALRLEGSGEALEEILDVYGKTPDELKIISQDKLFQKRVSAYREDIRANGTTFKVKARAQAEALLTTSWQLIHSQDVLPSVKADLIKSTVKWAGLEPSKEDGAQAGVSGGVTIHINLDGDNVPVVSKTVNPEVKTIEHEDSE